MLTIASDQYDFPIPCSYNFYSVHISMRVHDRTVVRYGNYVASLLEMLRANLHSLTCEIFESPSKFRRMSIDDDFGTHGANKVGSSPAVATLDPAGFWIGVGG